MSSTEIDAGRMPRLYKRLLKELWPYKLFIVVALIGNILIAGGEAGFTYIIRPILDKGFIARDPHFTRLLPLLILALFLTRGFGNLIANYYMNWVARSLVLDLRRRIFDALLRLPAKRYDQTHSGKLLSLLIYNVEQVTFAGTDALARLVQSSFMVVALLGVMFINSWKLSLFLVAVVPMIIGLVFYANRRIRRLSLSNQNVIGELSQITEETIEGYRVVRTFGGQAYEREKIDRVTHTNRRNDMKLVVTSCLSTSAVQLFGAVALLITLHLGTSRLIPISAGGFMSLVTAMLVMLKPLKQLTAVNGLIQRGLAGAMTIFDFLDQPPEQDTGELPLTRARGDIVFRDVRLNYLEDKPPALDGINLKISPAETIAFVGGSGGGKSSLVNLLPRFYEASEGEVLLDGRNIKDYRLEDLRRQFSIVSQQVVLFNDTIANNIAYGCREKVTDTAIWLAAEQADAARFIRQLPEGMSTQVGENGLTLSGGQRQRLAIARALLHDSPILIFDEATAALDSETEQAIQTALERLKGHRTLLIIAHRLSTIERADRIVVVEGGRILEQGTHADLLARNGRYAALYQK